VSTKFNYKTSVETNYQKLILKQKEFDALIANSANQDVNIDTTITWLQETKDILTLINDTIVLAIAEQRYSNQWVYLENTSIDANIATLKSLSSTINSSLTTVLNTTTTLKNYGSVDIQNLANDNTINAQKWWLTSAKNDLDNAKKALEESKKAMMHKFFQHNNQSILKIES